MLLNETSCRGVKLEKRRAVIEGIEFETGVLLNETSCQMKALSLKSA